MSKRIIDDEFLSEHIRKLEIKTLDELPKEEDLNHNFSKAFEDKMNKLIKEEKQSFFIRNFNRYGKRAAAILIIALSVSFLVTMSVEAYREKFFQVITDVKKEFTSVRIESDDEIVDRILKPINPGYIPEGFTILEENLNDYVNRTIYSNANDEEIIYEQRIISNGETIFDTEGVEVKTMEINNQEINFFTNKGVSQIYWNDDLDMYRLSSTIEQDKLIKVAKSIIKNK
nr:DUF4367 domain-containing protein [Tissierella sp.]